MFMQETKYLKFHTTNCLSQDIQLCLLIYKKLLYLVYQNYLDGLILIHFLQQLFTLHLISEI